MQGERAERLRRRVGDANQSSLVMRLLELWGYGEMSAHTAQSLAAAAAADLGDRNDKAAREIKSLASIGGHGKYGGNMQRDIINMYTTNMPDLYWAEIPIKDRL